MLLLFSYLSWQWSSLRGALCRPVAIQKLIKLLVVAVAVPSPLAGEGRVRGRRYWLMSLSFSYLSLLFVVVVVFSRRVVIAKANLFAALSPRGNPETDKAFVVSLLCSVTKTTNMKKDIEGFCAFPQNDRPTTNRKTAPRDSATSRRMTGYNKEVNGIEGFCAFPQNDRSTTNRKTAPMDSARARRMTGIDK
jgi:hypothetical protein